MWVLFQEIMMLNICYLYDYLISPNTSLTLYYSLYVA